MKEDSDNKKNERDWVYPHVQSATKHGAGKGKGNNESTLSRSRSTVHTRCIPRRLAITPGGLKAFRLSDSRLPPMSLDAVSPHAHNQNVK